MTDLRQEAIRELEKLPEENISIVLTIMKTMNELNDYKKNESTKENISDIETINAMKELKITVERALIHLMSSGTVWKNE